MMQCCEISASWHLDGFAAPLVDRLHGDGPTQQSFVFQIFLQRQPATPPSALQTDPQFMLFRQIQRASGRAFDTPVDPTDAG